jgi:hypothetical protein
VTASLRVRSRPCLGLRAGAQLVGDALALGAVGGELGLERLEPGGGRGGDRGQRVDECLGAREERLLGFELAGEDEDPLRALGPLARGALGDAALGVQLAGELRAADRRLALLGLLAPLLDEPAGPPLLLLGLRPRPVGLAARPVGLVAGGVGLGDRGVGALDGLPSGVLRLDRLL